MKNTGNNERDTKKWDTSGGCNLAKMELEPKKETPKKWYKAINRK